MLGETHSERKGRGNKIIGKIVPHRGEMTLDNYSVQVQKLAIHHTNIFVNDKKSGRTRRDAIANDMPKHCRSVTDMEKWALSQYMNCFALDLSTLVSAGLQVEGALVLQPPPVASDAADFLAVVIWRRVRKRGNRRIDAVALDAVEEGRIFLYNYRQRSIPLPAPLTNPRTRVNSVRTPLYARLNTWLPKMGPISQPAASMPSVLSPISIMGSKPPSCSDRTASYPLLIMKVSP